MTSSVHGEALTVCICTRNRADDLRLALESIASAQPPVAEVVVADDSTDERTQHLIAEHYPHVRYVRGPRCGLGANRNAALTQVRTHYVAFIDDDARLSAHFVSVWRDALEALSPCHRRVIFTGGERKDGALIHPRAVTFLGHQSRMYQPGDARRTIVINATVFPRALFDEASFDERLVYGSDEVDIAMHAVSLGYVIIWLPSLVNDHHPSSTNRDYYVGHAEAARLYVTMKRYARVDRSPAKAALYAIVGPAHLVCHAARRGGFRGVVAAAQSIGQAHGMWVRSRGPVTVRRRGAQLDRPTTSD